VERGGGGWDCFDCDVGSIKGGDLEQYLSVIKQKALHRYRGKKG